MVILKDIGKATQMLESIEKDINLMAESKSQENRMLQAKFYSMVGLLYSLKSDPVAARGFLSKSRELVTIYKSVTSNLKETKEIVCYNYAIEALNCPEKEYKIKLISKIENELCGNAGKEILVKYNQLLKILKKTIL